MSTDKAFSELALDFPKKTRHRAKIAGHTGHTHRGQNTLKMLLALKKVSEIAIS